MKRGFTLVEVLVAVAVIAIALAAGLRAAGVLIDNSQRLSDVIAAQWCAENHLTNLKLSRQFPGYRRGRIRLRTAGAALQRAHAGGQHPVRRPAAGRRQRQRRQRPAAGAAVDPALPALKR